MTLRREDGVRRPSGRVRPTDEQLRARAVGATSAELGGCEIAGDLVREREGAGSAVGHAPQLVNGFAVTSIETFKSAAQRANGGYCDESTATYILTSSRKMCLTEQEFALLRFQGPRGPSP